MLFNQEYKCKNIPKIAFTILHAYLAFHAFKAAILCAVATPTLHNAHGWLGC